MSTAPSTPPPPDESAEKNAAAIAKLEAQLEDCKDRHKEERFLWLAVTVILVTILFLHDSPSEFLPLAVVLLEIPILFFLAKRLGVESVAQLFDRLIGDLGRTTKNGG